jgi:hypothetical protein
MNNRPFIFSKQSKILDSKITILGIDTRTASLFLEMERSRLMSREVFRV